jgi:hypothetical protein
MSTHFIADLSVNQPIINITGQVPPPSFEQVLTEPVVTLLSYDTLTEYHLDRIKLDKEGKLRPRQVLKNHRSRIKKWREFHELTASSPVGEELGIGFHKRLADYLLHLHEFGNSHNTINDHKSTIHALRESCLEWKRTSGLPVAFHEALKFLVKESGCSLREIVHRTRVSMTTILSWMENKCCPKTTSIEMVHRLEDFFKVACGTLSSRLPEALWRKGGCTRGNYGTTPWRERQKTLIQSLYRMKSFPPLLEAEWERLYRFFTDPAWAKRKQLKPNSEWRVRWNLGTSPSGDRKKSLLKSFYGFLCLPVENEDALRRGKGFSPEEVSLAFLSDADHVFDYLSFMKERSVNKSYNAHTYSFLTFCKQLLRRETGYLWQQPEFGRLLPRPVAESEWRAWCEKNYAEIIDIIKTISKSKKDKFRKTRDPFDAVKEYIQDQQHPITVLWDLARNMEVLIPVLRRGSPLLLAIHWRNLFEVRFLSSNPLRITNLSMMTYIPKNWDDLKDPNKSYIETDQASNLYQKKDGSWWVRFNPEDFKNESGAASVAYDVPVVASVWPTLNEYLFRQRPILNRSLKQSINKRRALQELPLLTGEEELAIDRCRYVFRTSYFVISRMSDKSVAKYRGTEQMSPELLSETILQMSRTYIPGCVGFSAHACRHLVASEYIKNYPDGMAVAAAALHDRPETVEKCYAWITTEDKIRPWNDYHEELKQKYENGQL